MLKVKELSGRLFSATLADGKPIVLQAGEETTIKDDLLSESLSNAASYGMISVSAVTAEPEKPAATKAKAGGANKNG